jgi:outer membrane protein TolC
MHLPHRNAAAPRRWLLLLAVALGSSRAAVAQDQAVTEIVPTLSLADCRQLALQRQPRLAAQRASVAVAEEGRRALDNLRIPALIEPQLPVRRRQAELGVSAAAAGMAQTERDVIYAVTRTYYTVLYARMQERLAGGVTDSLTATHDAAKLQLEAGGNVTSTDVQRALVFLRLAEVKRAQALAGSKRALAALREAIGFGPDNCLEVTRGALPEPQVRLTRDEVVSLALSQRGDLARASIFADIACLEVEAQARSHQRRVETFAAGGDIHAVSVPQGHSNGEYRPGALPPEMPTLLVGTRPDRMLRAQSLHLRARAVADTARNLVALEAEDAFLRWEEATLQLVKAREAAETGDKMTESLSKDYTAGLRVKVEDVVNGRVIASQARAQYNEALYHQIVALADVERVTGGAFCAGLVEPAPLPQRLRDDMSWLGDQDRISLIDRAQFPPNRSVSDHGRPQVE